MAVRSPLEEMSVEEYRLVLASVVISGVLIISYFTYHHAKESLKKNVWKGVRHGIILKLLLYLAIRGFAFVVHFHYSVWFDILFLII